MDENDIIPLRTEEEDGGVRVYRDPGAPKVIDDHQILSFCCQFSAQDRIDPVTPLGERVYRLEAAVDGAAVTGRYRAWDRYDYRQDVTFRTDGRFMAELDEIVKKYRLTRFNGTCVRASGLPEDCGTSLDVRYASGASLWARDDQEGCLDLEAMIRLEAAFRSHTDLPQPDTDA